MNEKFLTEKINYYKFWLAFLITADVSIMAWGYNHFKTVSVVNFIFITFIFIGLTITIAILNKKTRNFLKNLEDYKNGN